VFALSILGAKPFAAFLEAVVITHVVGLTMTNHPVSQANNKQITCQELELFTISVGFFKISQLGKHIFEMVDKTSKALRMVPMVFLV
jgi:hypothetical protein